MSMATLDLQSGITADSVRRSITTASKHFNYISFKSQSNHFKEKGLLNLNPGRTRCLETWRKLGLSRQTVAKAIDRQERNEKD